MLRKPFLFMVLLSFVCMAGCKISGKIQEDGVGVQGAMVSISGNGPVRTVVTEPDGSFSIGALMPGLYKVKASLCGYTFEPELKEVSVPMSVQGASADFAAVSYEYDIFVDPESTGGEPGVYLNIQDAINAALPGQVIALKDADYSYSNNRNLNFNGKAITLRSWCGPNNCVIDCKGFETAGRGFIFNSGEGSGSKIIGLTIKNGKMENGGGIAIYNSSPTIEDCIFTENQATISGGAVYISNFSATPSPAIRNCEFTGNTAFSHGSVLYSENGSPEITGCTFERNRGNAGAVYFTNNCSGIISGSIFYDNASDLNGGGISIDNASTDVDGCTFTNNSAQLGGGGIYLSGGATSTISNCRFEYNNAENSNGGGIYIDNAESTVTGCVFYDNIAQNGGGIKIDNSDLATIINCRFESNLSDFGGGVYIDGASPAILNSVFFDNVADDGGGMYTYGGAVYGQSSPHITNCVFTMNSATRGGAIFTMDTSAYKSIPQITNCILWKDSGENEIDTLGMEPATTPEPIVTYSNIWMTSGEIYGTEEDHNINIDPLFKAFSNFHLVSNSSCVDSGNNSAPSIPALDYEGDNRVIDGNINGIAVADMGVDEYAP